MEHEAARHAEAGKIAEIDDHDLPPWSEVPHRALECFSPLGNDRKGIGHQDAVKSSLQRQLGRIGHFDPHVRPMGQGDPLPCACQHGRREIDSDQRARVAIQPLHDGREVAPGAASNLENAMRGLDAELANGPSAPVQAEPSRSVVNRRVHPVKSQDLLRARSQFRQSRGSVLLRRSGSKTSLELEHGPRLAPPNRN